MSGRVRDLPAWAAALPLWAGERWLWLTLSPTGLLAIRGDSANTESLQGDDPFASGPYDLVVVHSQRSSPVTPAMWTRLLAALRPGAMLLVCAEGRGHLRDEIATAAPGLSPSTWHVIEPDNEGSWRLRPATRPMHIWCDHHLSPPYSLRSWLRQSLRRWLPSSQRLACLPVWREDSR